MGAQVPTFFLLKIQPLCRNPCLSSVSSISASPLPDLFLMSYDCDSAVGLQIKFEEGIVGTPQLTDSIVVPEKVEFFGQNVDLSPFKGVITSIQDAASSVAKSISDRPPLKIPITNTNAESWLLTTYLDDELRISRGDGSSVFVLIKEGSPLLD